MLQPDKSDFVLDMIKDVEAHEARSHWTLIKRVKSTTSTKTIMGNSRLFSPFFLSSARDSHMEDELNTNPDSVHME